MVPPFQYASPPGGAVNAKLAMLPAVVTLTPHCEPSAMVALASVSRYLAMFSFTSMGGSRDARDILVAPAGTRIGYG